MGNESIGRRGLLLGAGAAGGLTVTGLAASAVPAAADSGRNQVQGSWLVTARSDDEQETLSVGSFAAGDVAIVHDIKPAGPPFTGTWEPRGGGRFRATLWSGFPGEEGPGSEGATARLRLVGRVDGDEISGTFTFTLFDPAGGEESFEGTFAGSRIEA